MKTNESERPMKDEPAFPCDMPDDINRFQRTGLTKREYFAAMAMEGLLSRPETHGHYGDFAGWSVQYADALLAELAKVRAE